MILRLLSYLWGAFTMGVISSMYFLGSKSQYFGFLVFCFLLSFIPSVVVWGAYILKTIIDLIDDDK